jgi:hypothetical protein
MAKHNRTPCSKASLLSSLCILLVLAGGLSTPTTAATGRVDTASESWPNWISLQPAFSTPFDAEAVAKLRIGELVEAIKISGQTGSTKSGTNLIPPALLIQAGLRTLLPPTQREAVALPGPANPNDPKELIAAQSNLTAVFQGGKVATPQERNLALGAVAQGARQLQADGYSKAAGILQGWLKEQGYQVP